MAKSAREREIGKTSLVGIIANTLLGIIKVVIGAITGSVAIITDAVNNFTDTSSSIITVIGTHLAGRRADMKHPFGFGRIEYLTSLVIGLIVFFTGVEMCRASIEKIIHPSPVHITVIAIVILIITIGVKIFLGQYTLKRGKALNSDALQASGLDARSDAVVTTATLVSAVLNLWKGITIDAWVGAIISLYIVYTGFDILRQTLSKVVGESVPRDFAAKLHSMVVADPMVIGAYDLILNNYGPNRYIGSINVEVDYRQSAGDIYRSLHRLQTKINRELNTPIVFGIYAINRDAPQEAHIMKLLRDYVAATPHLLGFHGLFVDDENKEIYCDVVADYHVDHDEVSSHLTKALSAEIPGYKININVDTPFIQVATTAKA